MGQFSHSLSLGNVVTPLGSRTPSGILFGVRPLALRQRVEGTFEKLYPVNRGGPMGMSPLQGAELLRESCLVFPLDF